MVAYVLKPVSLLYCATWTTVDFGPKQIQQETLKVNHILDKAYFVS